MQIIVIVTIIIIIIMIIIIIIIIIKWQVSYSPTALGGARLRG